MPPVDVSRVVKRFCCDQGIDAAIRALLDHYALYIPYENVERDVNNIVSAMRGSLPDAFDVDNPALELQMLEHHFYRNKAVYIVGRLVINGSEMPLVFPIAPQRKC